MIEGWRINNRVLYFFSGLFAQAALEQSDRALNEANELAAQQRQTHTEAMRKADAHIRELKARATKLQRETRAAQVELHRSRSLLRSAASNPEEPELGLEDQRWLQHVSGIFYLLFGGIFQAPLASSNNIEHLPILLQLEASLPSTSGGNQALLKVSQQQSENIAPPADTVTRGTIHHLQKENTLLRTAKQDAEERLLAAQNQLAEALENIAKLQREAATATQLVERAQQAAQHWFVGEGVDVVVVDAFMRVSFSNLWTTGAVKLLLHYRPPSWTRSLECLPLAVLVWSVLDLVLL